MNSRYRIADIVVLAILTLVVMGVICVLGVWAAGDGVSKTPAIVICVAAAGAVTTTGIVLLWAASDANRRPPRPPDPLPPSERRAILARPWRANVVDITPNGTRPARRKLPQ